MDKDAWKIYTKQAKSDIRACMQYDSINMKCSEQEKPQKQKADQWLPEAGDGGKWEVTDAGKRAFFSKNLIGVQLIYNAVSASGVEQSDSVMHIPKSILLQIPFPYRLLENIEQNSLSLTVDPWWLSILYVEVCIC